MEKVPIDIAEMFRRIREAVQPYRPAAMFELADEGYSSLFEQLLACIISIRTYDEMTVKLARQLFARARTPQEIADLGVIEVDRQIGASTFHERKAAQMVAIAKQVIERYGGELPCDEETLLSFSGVGVKCAHLALGVACHQKWISVDVHVHRVTNRWGYIATTTPEKTMLALQTKLPEEYWVEINRLLVPFGKHICTGVLPHCSTCPVLAMCQQVEVGKHR